MFLDAVMIAHPSIQDLSSEAELIPHDINPLPIAGYRRQIAFRTPGAHGQDRDLGTVVSVLHRGAKLFKVQTDISRNRNHQAYSAEGYQLSVA